MRVPGLVLALLLAGCLSGESPGDPSPPPFDLAEVYEVEHDHTDPAEHDHAWNVARVAYHALTGDGTPRGIAGEIDVAGDLAAVHLEGSRSGFALLDISDVTAPRFLSFTDAEAYRPFEARDVKLDPDGTFAYLALQLGVSLGAPPPPGGPTASGGFLVYSLTDPASPVLVAQAAEAGRGCHMIRYWENGGTRAVYCASTQGLAVYEIVEDALSPRTPRKAVTYVPREPDATAGQLAAGIDPASPVGAAGAVVVAVQPHDMTAQLDPLTGEPILVVPYERYGIRVLDISSPTSPVELAAWSWEGAEHPGKRMHTAFAHTSGERRLLVGVIEASGDEVTPLVLVGATDWDAPMLLAEWTPPDGRTSKGIRFSTHNVQAVGDRLYMAHFHAGVWVFDIAEPEAPRVVALYQDAEPGIDAEAEAIFGTGAPAIWDVVVVDGHVLASDMVSGLVVLHVAGDPAGDPGHRSFV